MWKVILSIFVAMVGIGALNGLDNFETVLSNMEREEIKAEIAEDVEVRSVLAQAQKELDRWLAERDRTKDLERAMLRHRLLVEAWETNYNNEKGVHDFDTTGGAHRSSSVRQTLHTCFFSWDRFFAVHSTLREMDLIDQDYDNMVKRLAGDILRPAERGANNRPFHFALGSIRAAKLYPDAAEAQQWKAYAEAVWNDWYEPGDTYEPSYIAHHFPQVIELGLLLGKENELKSPRIRKTWYRFRDQISPSGLAVSPGDGGPYDQQGYAKGLSKAAEITGDPTLLWAAREAFLAGTPETGRIPKAAAMRKLEEAFGGAFDPETTPKRPESGTHVQYLYPSTYRIPDRLILAPSREPNSPYAAFYLMDQTNTTFHGHEDNRGELYHWEVDGNLLLFRSGWAKWPEFANTTVIADSVDEYPFRNTRGVVPRHWYKGSSDLRILRHYMASSRWQHTSDRKHGLGQKGFRDTHRPIGHSWSNPDGLAGKNEKLEIQNVTLRFVTFPRAEVEADGSRYLTNLSFDPYLAWYRDSRTVAPSDGAVEVRVSRLHIAGPEGIKVLEDFEEVPGKLKIVYQPADSGTAGKTKERVIEGDKIEEFVRSVYDGELGKHVLQILARPGRTDLILEGFNRHVHLSNEYRRIGVDYAYQGGVRDYLRPPMRILVNEENPRSMYIDRQQGGVLKGVRSDEKGRDAFGEMVYEGVFTHDTDWTRQVVMTEEGWLAVYDRITPGTSADGMVGGPVWQMMNPPESGLHWFDADAAHPQYGGQNYLSKNEVHLMTYFRKERGHEYGIQYQEKLRGEFNYAAYSKARFQANKAETFITVLIPHGAGVSAESIARSVSIDSSGVISLTLDDRNVEIRVGEGGEWSVKR